MLMCLFSPGVRPRAGRKAHYGSCLHPAADSRRGGDRPRPDCAVLLARRWLGSWDGAITVTVARRSRAHGFSHVARYCPRSALGAAMVGSLLDAASHGPAGRWVLLCPTR